MFAEIDIKTGQPITESSQLVETGFKTLDIKTGEPVVYEEAGEAKSGFIPIDINTPVVQEPEEQISEVVPEEKNALLEGVKETGKFIGTQALATGEVAMSLASGALLWPFSKVWGTLNLPWGAEAAKAAEESMQSLGYTPYTEEGKGAMELVGKGFEIFLKPSTMAEKEMERGEYLGEYSDEAAYLLGFGGELAQFAMTGGAVKQIKAKATPKAKWEKPITEAPKLDTEFAEAMKAEQKSKINTRRALQKIKGRPLQKLKRAEERLAIERERGVKQAEYETTFKEIPIEKSEVVIEMGKRPEVELEIPKTEKEFKELPIEDVKPTKARPIKDTIQDVNALLGERGEIGSAALSKRQTEAFNRLKTDVQVFKRNAKRVNKSVEDYLLDMKVDPKIAALLGEKTTQLKKYAGSINLEKQDIPREFKEFETVISKPKKVQTWDETITKAEEILSDPKKTARVLKEKGATAPEVHAARQIQVNAIDSLKETLLKSPENFESHYNQLKKDVFDTTSDIMSEAGRALNIAKKEVSVNRMAKAFTELKRGLNKRELKEFKELDTNNPLEVKRFIQRLGDPKLSDYALEYWYNSILSGPPTHVVNTVGNTLWMTSQVPHAALTGAIDLPYSKLTGKPRTRYVNELLPMLLGYKTGWVRGKKIAGQIMRTGKVQEFETKWAQEMSSSIGAFDRSPNPIVRKAGKLITPPTNALRAMDAWGNAMAYDAAVGQMARRVSNQKGLKGKERAEFENKFAENLTEAQHMEAMKQAKHFTFMDDPDPATSLLIKARNTPVVGTAMRLTILPFVNTISNLMKRGMELTPVVGVAKEAVSRGMGRGKATPEVIAKQIEGAVIAAYVWDKIQKEEITGSMPESKAEREAWYRQGKMPWALKMGDSWVSYRRVEPFNTVIASAYVAYEAATKETDQKKIDEIFFEVAQGMKNNVIDGSYFQGLQAVMNRHQKSKGAVARWSASWVPYSSFFRSMSKAYEVASEGSAKARTGGDYQKAFSTVLPWLIDKPPAKLNVWGEEAVIPGGMLRQWLPFKWAEDKADIVEIELENLGFYPSIPSQTVRIKGQKVRLDDDIYRKYVQTFGVKAKSRIESLISTPQYQRVAKTGARNKQHTKSIKSHILRIRTLERKRAIKEQKKRGLNKEN